MYLEQLIRTIGGTYAQLLQQLHHEAAEPLEGARQSDLGVDFNEDVFVGVHVQALHSNQQA